MKLRTTRHLFKEGLLNITRNKLMFLASLCSALASLVILGIFLIIVINLNNFITSYDKQYEMEVFCKYDLDDSGVKAVEEAIKGNSQIQSYKYISKDQNFENMKNDLGNDATVLKGLDKSFAAVSFKIKLKDKKDSSEVEQKLLSINGVDNVVTSKELVETLSKIKYWVRIISIGLVSILLVISIFIISNTIKLTVFARRKEINIMKFIGATDSFIRWPFIIEGILIGIIASIVAYLITANLYNFISFKIGGTFANAYNSGSLKFTSIDSMRRLILGVMALVGCGIGAIGSFMSIRKYLKV